MAGGGHVEAAHEGAAVAYVPAGWWGWLARLLTEYVDADVFDGLFHDVQAGALGSVVGVADHAVDLAFMLGEERVDVGLVDEDAALFTWEDQVEVDAEADPRVERDPVEDKVELVLDDKEEGKGRPVH